MQTVGSSRYDEVDEVDDVDEVDENDEVDAVKRYKAGLKKAREGIDNGAHIGTIRSRPYVNLWTLAFTAPPASVLISENDSITSKNQDPTPKYIHHFASFLYRTVPILVWVVQLSLLVTLLYSITNNDMEFEHCANTRAWDIKFAATAVGLYYFTRMFLRSSQLYAMAFRNSTDGLILSGDRLPSFAPTFDFWYSQTFEYVVMFSNLYFILRSADSVQNVILRSISFRFIQAMDDKYVTESLKHPVISNYIIAMDAMSEPHVKSRSKKCMYHYGTYAFAVLPPLLAIVASISLAICL